MTVFNENIAIVEELLVLLSNVFLKGIADANRACDPLVDKEIVSDEDKYTQYKIILMDQAKALDYNQYSNVLKSYCTDKKLFALRNFIDYSNSALIEPIFTLANYIYRLGVKHTHKYDGTAINKLTRTLSISKKRFFCEQGFVRRTAWMDKVRLYITELEIQAPDKAESIRKLDVYIAQVNKIQNAILLAQKAENERNNFILAGGKI